MDGDRWPQRSEKVKSLDSLESLEAKITQRSRNADAAQTQRSRNADAAQTQRTTPQRNADESNNTSDPTSHSTLQRLNADESQPPQL